jgi:integrase
VRQGFFAHNDFERLASFLPEDLQGFVRFGYFTGWRLGQVQDLEWGEVEEGVIRLGPEKVKNKHGLVMPLVGEIADIIERRRRVRLEGIAWVFYRTQRGVMRQVGRFDKVWKTACAQAGLPIGKNDKKLFHDLRRTTARNLNRAGVPDPIAMRIMGHKTRAMYDRYNIVDEQDIGLALTQAEAHRKRSSHNPATSEEISKE